MVEVGAVEAPEEEDGDYSKVSQETLICGREKSCLERQLTKDCETDDDGPCFWAHWIARERPTCRKVDESSET